MQLHSTIIIKYTQTQNVGNNHPNTAKLLCIKIVILIQDHLASNVIFTFLQFSNTGLKTGEYNNCSTLILELVSNITNINL